MSTNYYVIQTRKPDVRTAKGDILAGTWGERVCEPRFFDQRDAKETMSFARTEAARRMVETHLEHRVSTWYPTAGAHTIGDVK